MGELCGWAWRKRQSLDLAAGAQMSSTLTGDCPTTRWITVSAGLTMPTIPAVSRCASPFTTWSSSPEMT